MDPRSRVADSGFSSDQRGETDMSTTLKELCLSVAIAVEISAAKWVVAS